MLVERLDGVPIGGKAMVASSCSLRHDQVQALLQDAYQARVELLCLDKIFTTLQLAGFIERQLRYLDAAAAELKQSLRQR